jgi:hypothetical protein
MKFNFEYVKKNPLMFGAIFVVFGLFLWLALNRGSGGTTEYVATGPSEALQAANLQAATAIQGQQIQASSQNAIAAYQLEAMSRQIEGDQSLAILEVQYKTLELAATERMTQGQTEASLLALQAQLNNSLSLANENNSFMVDYAKVAADSAMQTVAINAALQRAMSADQLEAYKVGAETSKLGFLASVIPSVKANDRDNAFALLTAVATDTPLSYKDKSSGSFNVNNPTTTAVQQKSGSFLGGFGGLIGSVV